jgi:large subunit ribosomal protein L15
MTTLNTLAPHPWSTQKRLRIARGLGSWKGGTSGRGNKGQNARSGAKRYPTFEWGQTPLFRRIPKKRGFTAHNPKQYTILNLNDLSTLASAGSLVLDRAFFLEKKVIRNERDLIKILANGELWVAVTVTANAFSAWAKAKIEKAGGTIIEG